MKIAVVTSGFLPIPAVHGGAVEVLNDYLISENEIYGKIDLYFISIFDYEAKLKSFKLKRSKVIYITVPKFILFIDKFINFCSKKFFKNNSPTRYRYIFQRVWYMYKAAVVLKKNNFDKVIIDNQGVGYLALKLKKNYLKYQNRYYFHVHNIVQDPFNLKQLMKKTKKIIGVSEYINKTVVDYLESKNSNQCVILKNAVNRCVFSIVLEENKKAKVRNSLGLKMSDFVFMFAGRIVEEKGVLELIKAFKLANITSGKLLIIGENSLSSKCESNYETKIKRELKNWEDRILFSGFISNNDLGIIYQSIDVVVVPSLWEDPAPLSVIEALVAGSALITTLSGGIGEYASDDSAILLNKESKDFVFNLSKTMEKMQNPYLLKKLRLNAKKVSKNWSIENYYKEFCEILSKDD